jgi:hypothetical protein
LSRPDCWICILIRWPFSRDEGWPHEGYLRELLDAEVQSRQEWAAASRLREAQGDARALLTPDRGRAQDLRASLAAWVASSPAANPAGSQLFVP